MTTSETLGADLRASIAIGRLQRLETEVGHACTTLTLLRQRIRIAIDAAVAAPDAHEAAVTPAKERQILDRILHDAVRSGPPGAEESEMQVRVRGELDGAIRARMDAARDVRALTDEQLVEAITNLNTACPNCGEEGDHCTGLDSEDEEIYACKFNKAHDIDAAALRNEVRRREKESGLPGATRTNGNGTPQPPLVPALASAAPGLSPPAVLLGNGEYATPWPNGGGH